MATIKRKKVARVANAPKKSFKDLLHSKRFWIICSIIVASLALIGVAIFLIVYFTTSSSSDETAPDYFGGEIETIDYKYNDEVITFQKLSYDGIKMVHNYDNDLNIYVMALDLSAFYPDKTIDDGKNTDDGDVLLYSDTDKNLWNGLKSLQAEINKYNKGFDGDVVKLYIVDTSLAINKSIASDSLFGGSDDSSATTIFSYMNIDGYKAKYKIDGSEKKIYSTSKNEIVTTVINNAINFMNGNFVSETE